MTGSDEITKKLDELAEAFEKFQVQYNLDMRGDTTIDGNRGMVNEVRETKKILTDYPSITWLLTHRTAQTLASIFGALVFFQVIWYLGVVGIIGKMLGVDLGEITSALQTLTP